MAYNLSHESHHPYLRHLGGPGGAYFICCDNNCLVIVDCTGNDLVPFHTVVSILERVRAPHLGQPGRFRAQTGPLLGASSIDIYVCGVVSTLAFILLLAALTRADWHCSTAYSTAAFILQVHILADVPIQV